jgi:hypothetical protein
MNERAKRLPSRSVLLQLGGVAAVAAGAGVVYWPAGLITAGVLAVAVGTVAELNESGP